MEDWNRVCSSRRCFFQPFSSLCPKSPIVHHFTNLFQYLYRDQTENQLWKLERCYYGWGPKISHLRNVDNTTLFTTTIFQMHELISRMVRLSLEFGLYVNRSKTRIMIVDLASNILPDATKIANYKVVPSYIFLETLTSIGETMYMKSNCVRYFANLRWTRYKRYAGLLTLPKSQGLGSAKLWFCPSFCMLQRHEPCGRTRRKRLTYWKCGAEGWWRKYQGQNFGLINL